MSKKTKKKETVKVQPHTVVTQETLERQSKVVQYQRLIAIKEFNMLYCNLSARHQIACTRLANLQIKEEAAAKVA